MQWVLLLLLPLLLPPPFLLVAGFRADPARTIRARLRGALLILPRVLVAGFRADPARTIRARLRGALLILPCVLVAGCSVDTAGLARDAAVDARFAIRTDAATDAADRRRDARAPARPDAGATDAAPPDAGFDAAEPVEPTWTVIETLVVDTASSEPTTSRTTLEAGVTYRLRVSGTIVNVIDEHMGDADYYDFDDPKDHGCCEDIGLGIDDLDVYDNDTQPDWGPYDPTHVYEVAWVGDGTTITALFQDTYYGNNIGELTLEILDLR